jgi:4,5-epoxidase
MSTGIMDAHNLAWKLALVAAGQAAESLLDSYGTERRPVAEDVLRLTHALVRYGTITHPVQRRIRDLAVPALGRTAMVQRRAVRRLSQVYVAYPAGPSAGSGRGRRGPRPGQRMPDLAVRAGGEVTRVHAVLRGGRPMLVVPPACLAGVLDDPWLRAFREDVAVVTGEASGIRNGAAGPVILVRPDGYVAARGRPGDLRAVTAFLRILVGEPAVAGSGGGRPAMG